MSNEISSSKSAYVVTGTRFSPITESDKAGILWIASLLSGIYSFLSLSVRLYIKRKFFGYDDWMCLAATFVGAASFIAIYVGLSNGLGKAFVHDPISLRRIGRAVFASRIAFVLANALSKSSVVLLIRRVFSLDMSHHLMLCNITLAATALWASGSLVSVSVTCAPEGLVNGEALTCARQATRWQAIGIFDAITELLINFLSLGLVWRLNMRFELKVRVILAFTFRLLLIAIAVVHIRYILYMPAVKLNLNIIPALTIEQIQLSYALISATLPNLKSFIMSFNTAMMMDFGEYQAPSHARTPLSLRCTGEKQQQVYCQGQNCNMETSSRVEWIEMRHLEKSANSLAENYEGSAEKLIRLV
ncbi:uncharacterized protein PV09_06379 [Verruconis gallopava]|uniref:Rhodopsin domain-containing protein n=1 Tax=Verruconis gallopava TaxID=253628 RepID=A0A0D2A6M1_9PEZI|nr:uncharacterized protein PV09_06379 [Verruconis gallopava]KIW02225.1 hypothetical protein PV09_06379 [Verruconis gallopava]